VSYWCRFGTGVVGTTGKFAASIVDTGGKFDTGDNNTSGTGGQKFAAGVVDTGGKFAAGVVNTGGNFATNVIETGGKFATGVNEYIPEFSKKIAMTLMIFSGAWGKVIHEKDLKQKISLHCPFNIRHATICTVYSLSVKWASSYIF
jgi:hypothetical protein